MHNPFAQVSQYFQLAFDVPYALAEHAQNAFEDVAL